MQYDLSELKKSVTLKKTYLYCHNIIPPIPNS